MIGKQAYLKIIETDFIQWKKSGHCQRAIHLNEKIGYDYFDTSNPQYFVGNLESEIVLVHLNPKRGQSKNGNDKKGWYKACPENYRNFDDYLNNFLHFGEKHYGETSEKKHKSLFDHKQIRFLRPFNVLKLNNQDKYINLKNVIDDKLQLELVPYGSPNFNYKKIDSKILQPFVHDLIGLISAYDRKYIIFCGRVFIDLLEPYLSKIKKYKFNVKKNNGTDFRFDFDIINIEITFNDMKINATIAPQFALNGYSEERYGKKIKDLYCNFD